MGQGESPEPQVTQASWWQGQGESGKAPGTSSAPEEGQKLQAPEAAPTTAAGRQLMSAVTEASSPPQQPLTFLPSTPQALGSNCCLPAFDEGSGPAVMVPQSLSLGTGARGRDSVQDWGHPSALSNDRFLSPEEQCPVL